MDVNLQIAIAFLILYKFAEQILFDARKSNSFGVSVLFWFVMFVCMLISIYNVARFIWVSI